jgi:siroheme synthase (precorrin-2 oxidase/ferrochelatase)
MNYIKLIAWAFNSRQEPIPIFSDEELSRLLMPLIVFVGKKDIMLRSDETAERIAKLCKRQIAERLSIAPRT